MIGRQMFSAPRVGYISRHRGDLSRGEGRLNFPYGPLAKHARKSILNVHADGAHGLKPYPTRNHSAGESYSVDLDSLNREELRALCKDRKVPRWGKMTTAQMKEALR